MNSGVADETYDRRPLLLTLPSIWIWELLERAISVLGVLSILAFLVIQGRANVPAIAVTLRIHHC